MATHTRLTPKQRCEQLSLLIKNIRETPAALKQITNWGLELGETLECVCIFFLILNFLSNNFFFISLILINLLS